MTLALFPETASATFSPCKRYRYTLTRRWGPKPALTFVMLNPSTADAEQLDPTVNRCLGYARREGAGGLLVLNIMAYRATDPRKLQQADDPVGPRNHETLRGQLAAAQKVVAAWGAHSATKFDGAVESIRIVREVAAGRLYCLKRTTSGAPGHPLYLRKDAPLVPWGGRCAV